MSNSEARPEMTEAEYKAELAKLIEQSKTEDHPSMLDYIHRRIASIREELGK
jgi:hypothetical protein